MPHFSFIGLTKADDADAAKYSYEHQRIQPPIKETKSADAGFAIILETSVDRLSRCVTW